MTLMERPNDGNMAHRLRPLTEMTGMATAYDTWKTDAPEPYEIDEAAYEALKAHPVMAEEAMTNQDGAFWAKVAMHIKVGTVNLLHILLSVSVDKYVKEQVEEFASDEEISINEAIHKLLNRCNGGK